MSRRLNCGCGQYPLRGFINIDKNQTLRADVYAEMPSIPFGDGKLDEVWACHFLEHLERDQADIFLSECYRVLRQGGMCAMVVPDTREVMRRYLEHSIDAVELPYRTWHKINDLDAICRLFLYSTVENSRHHWSYDSDTLWSAMWHAGFRDMAQIDRYDDPRIVQGAWYQLGWQGVKR